MSGLQYIIPIVVLVLVFGLKGFREVKDYLLKREQIKADALVRSEALRLKNEIELEKLIQNDFGSAGNKDKTNTEDSKNTDSRNNDRLRY